MRIGKYKLNSYEILMLIGTGIIVLGNVINTIINLTRFL